MKRLLGAWLCCLCLSVFVNAQEIRVTWNQGRVIVENQVIKRIFVADSSFFPVSIYDKRTKTEYLQEDAHAPWFYVPLDTPLTDVRYEAHTRRPLNHGGTEISFILQNDRVLVRYRLQMFPGSAMFREKWSLAPVDDTKSLRLKRSDSQPQCILANYRLAFTPEQWQEIRLASWNREQMPDAQVNAFPLSRPWQPGDHGGTNLSQCHMYHPAFLDFNPTDGSPRKGPVVMAHHSSGSGLWMAYEHGSPDNDPLRTFLHIKSGERLGVEGKRGILLPGEPITDDHPFESVWIDMGLWTGTDFHAGYESFWTFISQWQSQHLASRRPLIYYNTWGWQRDDQREYVSFSQLGDSLQSTDVYGDARVHEPLTYHDIRSGKGPRTFFSPRSVLQNQERLLKEIEYAHQLGVDVFVLDDGWFDWMGDWNVNRDAFPEGLKPIKQKLDQYGMRMGLWLAPFCVDKKSRTFVQHPEYMARARDGDVLKGGWGREMACLVSGYSDYFIERCKRLIDLGCTYFKWDGLDGQYCYAANHTHGDESHTADQRGERYGFEYIREITRIARELNRYSPNLVIVYDMTEKGRNVGLQFLSEGRFFWMNNGASGYDDLSTYRTKSMRTVPYEYHKILPSVLQTYATYPHDASPFHAQEYNVCTTILGGNGFWGDLSEMNEQSRSRVHSLLSLYKQVAPAAVSAWPRVVGRIGSSPEIYELVDSDRAEGQILAFSASVLAHRHVSKRLNPERFLAVLRHAYELRDGMLHIDFEFTEPEAVRQAFVLGNNDTGIRISRSTTWLQDVQLSDVNDLRVRNGAPGKIYVFWPAALGLPRISGSSKAVTWQTQNVTNGRQIIVNVSQPGLEFMIKNL
ncbi:hypothetical protein GF406_20405 [candidate division KSB1 bacterium]|nr:hypothetical protein [candidate division KSB1 bacterium]